ncbi:hypothetical protein YTPLAS72_08340 [Nitrospira sp.]|nr:hypothetical protein YTPLAS72_08340 [Nitrospira sp.]
MQWRSASGMSWEGGLNERDSSIGSETGQTDALLRTLTLLSMATILESYLSMEKGKQVKRRIYAEG